MQDKRSYLYHVFFRINRYFMHSRHDNGLTPGEFGVIWTINQSEGKALHPSSISQQMGIARPSLTPILRELESRGLIQRRADVGDGRRYLVELTEKCHEFRTGQIRRQQLLFDKLIGTLEQQELDDLLRILHKMEENLQSENQCEEHGEPFV